MTDPITTLITVIPSLIVGAWIHSFFSKSAEIDAIQSKLTTVITQNEAITRANETIKAQIAEKTEAIKAEIAGGLWDRQKRWEVRRDVILEYMRKRRPRR